ncbi:hypothetical protein GCM10023321_17810 [Pseudonocardia eucalypti]|uniref:Calcineurin-like phosphoesterase domain-containing protein n=2 Tax=Pseudonocardia eucalypti TaxID=648755 RepID=A0ABP9PS50_9PSEU
MLAGALGALGVVATGGLVVPLAGAEGTRKYGFPADERFRVLVTGDAGTDGAEHFAVTGAALAEHRRRPFGMALGLGDNIYEYGPFSSDDPQFESKFEKPNDGLDFPWLMAQGNHDNSGLLPGTGDWEARGQYEVEYHERSRRWFMPARYYSVRVPEDRPVAEFFVIDTNPVTSYVPQLLPYWTFNGEYMHRQRRWLRAGLASSPARYRFVCSHHPYVNNGPHGNAGSYDGITIGNYASGRHLKTWYEQDVLGTAHAILSGHDHSQQVLEPVRGTVQVVSGAASKTVNGSSRVTNPYDFQDFTGYGFMAMDVSPEGVDLAVHRVDTETERSEVVHRQRLATHARD